MKRLVEKYAAIPPEAIDYETLLRETNVFGEGRTLVPDERARAQLAALLSRAESRIDLAAATEFLNGTQPWAPERMFVSCELEYWAFFEPNRFTRVLYVGCGAWPAIALYALEREPALVVDGVDIDPEATALCSRVAEKFGYRDRLRPDTLNALELEPVKIRTYGGFFISSAVRPKNDVIRYLLAHKTAGARIYAREDAAHPDFYEPVTVEHPDVMSARQARALWESEKGVSHPLPAGCEID